MSTVATAPYTCRYCRMGSDGTGTSCPHCGAPVNVKDRVSDSGWEEQPPIRDMAKIQFGQSICQVSGKYVPVADMALAGGDSVYFSHHVLLWAEPAVQMNAMSLAGGWNRTMAGMPLVMMEAHGPGHIAFSHDDPGETVAIPLQHGQAVDVREHRFLVATGSVDYTWFQSGVWYSTQNGDDTEYHYPLGQFMDRYYANTGPGLLLLHSPGNVFVRDLQHGQAICIQPSALVYKDPNVGMQLHLEYPAGGGIFGGYVSRTVWLRLWGPGRVAIQSVFERPEGANNITNHSMATSQSWR